MMEQSNYNNDYKDDNNKDGVNEDDDVSSSSSSSSDALVEKTISLMESSNGLCVHPRHSHSFQKVTFFLSALGFRNCAGCNSSLQSVLFGTSMSNLDTGGGGGGESSEVVKCVACGAVAHRSCALSSSKTWAGPVCSVNSTLVAEQQQQQQQKKEREQQKKQQEQQQHKLQKQQEQQKQQQEQQKQQQEQQQQTQLEIQPCEKNIPPQQQTKPLQEQQQQQPTEDISFSASSIFNFFSMSAQIDTTKEISKDDDNNDKCPDKKDTVGTDAGAVINFDDDDAQEAASFLDEDPLIADTATGDDWNNMSWTEQGPPAHWALSSPDTLNGLVPSGTKRKEDDDDDGPQTNTDNNNETTEPLHYAAYPFASVSRALQENIVAHFSIRSTTNPTNKKEEDDENTSKDRDEQQQKMIEQQQKQQQQQQQQAAQQVKKAVTQIQLPPGPPPSTTEAIMQVASGTYESVKKVEVTRSRLGIASVAGGIAGGVAGLYIAGPVGAVLGVKYGQTAGVLGVLLEGSVSVGVVVAGVVSASKTALQLQEQIETSKTRVITMGEDGTSRKLLLVRPNIKIDPIWQQITKHAQQAYARSKQQQQEEQLTKIRYARVDDIVEANEDEIPTPDKVLLLVSRLLNDKHSYPGYIYRYLIIVHKDRYMKRRKDQQKQKLHRQTSASSSSSSLSVTIATSATENDSGAAPKLSSDTEMSLLRETRQDTHAVIKHVTATLLEVRPGFASSPIITELTATAVESLVFGEVYDFVLEEIACETSADDEALLKKIELFEQREKKRFATAASASSLNDDNYDVVDAVQLQKDINNERASTTTKVAEETNEKSKAPVEMMYMISEEAIDALRSIPRAHSAVEKISYCVRFLEYISQQIPLEICGADSLLKMVCQHIIIAKVPNIHSEVAFIEEFARDEQLLKGKDGYSLVTLQASLHFLTSSIDFQKCIFDSGSNVDDIGQQPKENDEDEGEYVTYNDDDDDYNNIDSNDDEIIV